MFKKILVAAAVIAVSAGSAFASAQHCQCCRMNGMNGQPPMPPRFEARSADRQIPQDVREIQEAKRLTAEELFKEKPDKAKAAKLFAKEQKLVMARAEKKYQERLANPNDAKAKRYWMNKLSSALRAPNADAQWVDFCCEMSKSRPDKEKISALHDGAMKVYGEKRNERFEKMLKNPPKPFAQQSGNRPPHAMHGQGAMPMPPMPPLED